MALVDSREVSLAIHAEVGGHSDVSKLVSEVEALAREGGAAAPKFAALAAELRAFGGQNSAAAQITALRAETEKLGRELEATDDRAAGLRNTLGYATEETAQAAQANAAASARLAEASAQHQSLKQAVADTTGELRKLEAAAKTSGDAAGEYAGKIDTAKARLDQYKADAKAAGESVRQLAAEHKASAASLREAEQAEKRLSSEYDKTVTSAKKLSGQIDEKNRALTTARETLQAAGVDTARLGEEQKRLGSALADVVKRIDEERAAAANANPALKTLGTSAEQANAALARIGIRSAAQIKAEISQINQDLLKLAANSNLSAEDLDRAFAHAQRRIAALEQEMSGSVDPFTASVGRATGGLGQLLTNLGPVGRAVATAFAVDQLARAAVEFDRMSRTLEAVSGSGQAAAQELGYITEASQRLGLELGTASRAYANFMAATRGTTLEGQKGREVFEAIAGAMSKLGKSSADTEGALLAVGQMVSKGVVSMEELRQQLAERLPGAMQAAANGAGVTVAELTKMVESGQVLAEDLLPAMAAELKALYGTSAGVEGYTASWNRFANAITETAGRIGQTDAVMKSTTGALWLLEKAAQGAGLVVLGFAEAVSLLGGSLGALAGAVESGNWSQLGDAISAMAQKSGANLSEMRSRLLGVQDASTGAGSAARNAAEQALAGNPGWLRVAGAYTQVTASIDAYVKQSEKALEARQAEASAAVAFAQMSGNEAQLRQAEAAGATAVAEATRRLAEAKAAQLSTTQAELATKQQVAAADAKESEAKRQLIEKISEKISLQQEEASKAQAAAQAAQIEAAARRAAAEAVKDNSNRVVELRDAYQQALVTLEKVRVARAAGKTDAEALTAAELAAGRAAYLYRDALSDQAAAIQASLSVKQAQNQLDQTNVQLAISVAQRAYELAKAKGNEKEATEELLRIKRLEVDIAELQAKALQAQAEAELLAIKNKREQAKASGTLTEQLKAELKAEQLAAEAKVVQGKIAGEVAGKLRDLAAEAEKSGNTVQRSMNGAAEATSKVADAASQASKNFWEMSEAARQAETDAERLSRWEAESSGSGRSAAGSAGYTERGAFERAKQAGLSDSQALQLTEDYMKMRNSIEGIFRFQDAIDEAVMSNARKRAAEEGSSDTAARPLESARNVGTQPQWMPERVVQVNLSAGGRESVPVFTSMTDADRLLKDLEFASMRSS